MNTPSHSCPVAYHEGHVLLCFMSGKPCIYMDDRSCEKAREYHIRESERINHSQENKTKQSLTAKGDRHSSLDKLDKTLDTHVQLYFKFPRRPELYDMGVRI